MALQREGKHRRQHSTTPPGEDRKHAEAIAMYIRLLVAVIQLMYLLHGAPGPWQLR